MDLHQLFVFLKVVEHKSFSKAAEEIFLSQSTVSSHIHSLEKAFNVPLFDRIGRESILTPHGERLYAWAQQMIGLKDELILDMKQGMTDFSGTIKVAASSVPCHVVIPRMINKFRKDYENVSFLVNQYPSKGVYEKISKGAADIGILGEKFDDENLHYIPILKEKLLLITPKDLKIETPVQLEKLIQYPFIMRGADSGTQSLVDKILKKHDIPKDSFQVAARTDSFHSLIKLVQLGTGISLVSELAAKDYAEKEQIEIYQLDDLNEERDFYLVYNKNITLPLAAKILIEQIEQYV